MVDSTVMQAGRYKAYPEYKDSGVEWLGEIPSGWNSSAVWMQFEIGRGRVISNEEIASNVGIYPVYSSQTFNDGVMGYIDTYDFDGNYITWTTDGANAGTVFTRSGKFNCTNVCGTLKSNKSETNIRFYMYALSMANKWFVRHDINPKLMNNVISAIRVPVCSILEQKQIANFLDHETAKIDTLIEKQKRLIELLTEKRQAVISYAVTKGLNPDVLMKDSGVEWLGEIPEHWEIYKLSYLARPINGDRGSNYPSADEFVEEGIPFISSNELVGGYVRRDLSPKITLSKYKQLGGLKIQCGDILYCLRGGVGKSGLCTFNEGTISSSLMGIRSQSIEPNYLMLLLNSSVELQQRSAIVTGSVSPNLSAQNVMEYKFAVPGRSEQLQIVNYVVETIEKIDALLNKAQQQIQLMQERRTALISAAVTGKIDVRDWVKPE